VQVISLALILQNPAPVEPKSGSTTTIKSNGSNSFESVVVGWDPNWRRDAGQNPLKGSIISRGTLVVVSPRKN
jgi:hypothetical protein